MQVQYTDNEKEICEKLEKGYADFESGRVQNAAEAFEKYRNSI